MKTYVLIVSDKFPATHPRKGEPTGFVDGILFGGKEHTIRRNYELWEKRVEEIQRGEARLSIRRWTGLPYRSKQEEVFSMGAHSSIGVECLTLTDQKFMVVENSIADAKAIARNDGLSWPDFQAWFQGWNGEPMAIIHFTKMRYAA